MKTDYPETDDGTGRDQQLLKGETVLVVGASTKRGHLLVERNSAQLNVPYQYMELPVFSSKCSSNGTTVPGVNM
jgi:dachs protein